MIDLCYAEGVENVRRSGRVFVGRCPFHDERSASFTIFEDHAHCFGCGWHGGPVKFLRERRGLTREEAIERLGGRYAQRRTSNVEHRAPNTERGRELPELPEFGRLTSEGLAVLAKLRGLSMEGLRLASEAGVLFGCAWPRRMVGEHWVTSADAAASWVVTDASRRVAQFRRLDGAPYRMADRELKAWTRGSPSWPVGADALASETPNPKPQTPNIMLVEGGADLLAAYYFLSLACNLGSARRPRFVQPHFTPVAMLGASARIGEDALDLFARKRVRILRHNDEAGLRGAAVWTEQLTAAGAAVETCCFSELTSGSMLRTALFNFDF